MRRIAIFRLQNIGRIFFLLFGLTLPQILLATVYYVDASGGNDANNGFSPETAWKNIARVNGSMINFNPGDRILLKRGTRFTDSRIEITKGGAAGERLIFGAYGSGDKPIITHPLGGIVCVTPGIGYITIQDLCIKDITDESGIAFNASGGSDIVISRVDIDHVPHHNGIVLMNIDTYIIEDCVISNCENSGIAIMGSASFPITNGIIRNNTVHDIFTNDGITLHQDGQGHNIGPNHQLLGNVCYRCAEQGLDITSGSRLVMRGNETFSNGDSGILLGNASDVWIDKHYCHDELKMGIIIGGATRVKLTSSILYNASYHQLTIVPSTLCRDFEAYNNTFVYGPDSTGLLIDINANASNLKFKNNVFTSTQYDKPKTLVRFFGGATPADTKSYFNYNIWWRPGGSSLDIFSDLSAGNYDFSYWQSHYGQGTQSAFIDPLLVDTKSGNFRPEYNSPCIDAGTDVGLSSDFAGILIPFGPAPDIGAHEYEIQNNPLNLSLNASTTFGQIPLLVNFTCLISGGSPPYLFTWDFGDGGFSLEKDASHTYSRAGTFIAKLTVIDSHMATNAKSISINVTASSTSLIATATADPAFGQAPLAVKFVGTAMGGIPLYTYSWNFGDGQSSPAQSPSHTYFTIGNFAATLTVTDSSSANADITINIAVGSVTGASLALAAATGAPAPGRGGTTDPSPGTHSFSIGSKVLVRSIPQADYRFSRWAGDITESSTFSPAAALTMDKDKSLSATFCTRCADVNGDLRITPADAQFAFDIYLGRIANPTWCEFENADVNCNGADLSPMVTPADALMIFHKYLGKEVISSDCSGSSRAASLSMQGTGFTNVNLIINNVAFTPGQDILIPVIIESESDIRAFGFDLAFPSNVLTFIGLERTDLTKRFDQLDANVIPYQAIILMNSQVLRVGGYKTTPGVNPSCGVLVTLIFRVTGKTKDPNLVSVIATYDHIQNASIRNGMTNPQNKTGDRKIEKQVINVERKFPGKRYEF
jgi:PKD repeat protein